MKTIYICTDTVTGIFSGIYDAWKAEGEEDTCGIALRGGIGAAALLRLCGDGGDGA